MARTALCLSLLSLLASYAEDRASDDAWTRFESRLLSSDSLVSCYSFESLSRDDSDVGDRGNSKRPMTFVPAQKAQVFKVVEGRWPGRPAVQLDASCFAAMPFDVKDGFTVSAWMKIGDAGTLRGNGGAPGGTLLSAGIGYWDGWRLTITYPDRRLGLEIGRPAPTNSISVRSPERLVEDAWVHVCVTWDRRIMTVWTNGRPVARREYSGPYFPPKPDGRFKLGYAGFGWGSAQVTCDHVSVHNRALTPEEILAEVYYSTELSPGDRKSLASAHADFLSGDFDAAMRTYQQLSTNTESGPIRAGTKLHLGLVALKQRKVDEAAKEFIAILDSAELHGTFAAQAMEGLFEIAQRGGANLPVDILERILKRPGLSDTERSLAQIKIARSYRNTKDFPRSRKLYEEVLSSPHLNGGQRTALRYELAHLLREAGAFEDAVRLYQSLHADSKSTTAQRALAEKCLAQTRIELGQFGSAVTVLTALAESQDAPSQFKEEALHDLRQLTGQEPASPPRDYSHLQSALLTPAAILYVAPDGNDDHPGSLDKPFRTIDKARLAVRKLSKDRPVCVSLREGVYRLSSGLVWSKEDSGRPEAPVIYRAYNDEKAVISGGVALKGFQSVTDAEVLRKMPASSSKSIVYTDLAKQGITDFGELKPRGFGRVPSDAAGLFIGGNFLPLARWPDEGYSRTGKLSETNDETFSFEFTNNQIHRWTGASQAWLRGYWYWDWADESLALGSVVPNKMQLQLRHRPGKYGARDNRRFLIFNLLEELDQPGEWFLDRNNGRLYLYPPGKLEEIGPVEFSMLSGPLIQLNEVSDVVFQNLVIESGRGDGIAVHGGERVLIAGCHIRQFGGEGVRINGGRQHGLYGCDIYAMGRGGVRASGGDRKTLTPGQHFIENCHIHHLSNLDRTYTPAVWMDGVGNRIVHNHMHHIPSSAMRIEGNDHLIELNDVHDCVFESDDQGGLDMWFNPTYRGNIIRYNFWHDIGSGEEMLGQSGVRLDDAISGVLIYGNVFYRCSNAHFGAIQIHGGKDNIVDSNIFIDCKYAVSFSGWGLQRWGKFVESERVKKAISAVNATGDLYLSRYPKVADFENPDRNVFWRNTVVDCGQFFERSRVDHETLDNYITSGEAGFVGRAKMDFSLRDDSEVYKRTGTAPIPFNQIGTYSHPLRTTIESEQR